MDGLDKLIISLIISLVIAGVVAFAMLGLSIYLGTHPDYGMTTVKTGDVTWVCLTDHGTTIGCDTVEEYQ